MTGVLAGMQIGVLAGVLTEELTGVTDLLTGNITSMHNFRNVISTTMTPQERLKKELYSATTEKNTYKQKLLKSTN